MKIGIISDTHDNIPNIEKAINWMNQNRVERLLHCGDISTRETMEFISRKFPGEIFAVFGNMDVGKNRNWEFPNVKLYPEICEIKLDGNSSTGSGRRKISFCHMPKKAKELAKTEKYDIVFYGHTHKPWEEKILVSPKPEGEGGGGGSCRLVNPGNIAGIIYNPTFAVYNTSTDKLELKILEKL